MHTACLGAGLGTADVVLHPLTLHQGAEALARDLGVVDEDVGPATVLGDEAEPLLAVEPLDRAACHLSCYRGYENGPTIAASSAAVQVRRSAVRARWERGFGGWPIRDT